MGAAAEVRELKKRIRELERVLGRRPENEILKEAVSVEREKLISRLPCLPDEDFQ